MKSVQIRIIGESPLLMHAFPAHTPEGMDKMPPEEQAKYHLYSNGNKDAPIYVPSENMRRALVAGAAYSKGKGRASLAKEAAAALFVEPDHCTLTPQTYAIDSRPVVIPATKGRILRHRPRWDEWELSFRIRYDERLFSEAALNKVLVDTGQRVGILDYRPEKKGPFGRFRVTLFSAD